MIRLGSLAFISLMLASSLSFACTPSVGPGVSNRIATNVELVQNADLIVLGRIVEGPPPGAKIGVPWADEPKIIVEPVEILKGSSSKAPLRLFGSIYERDGSAVQPAPTSLSEAHPNAYTGGCVRTLFSKGTLVVAMFRETPNGLRQLSFPLARDIEDVADSNATWVRAVKYYVSASATRPQNRRQAFSELRARLVRRGGAADLDIAKDIATYLKLDLGTKQAAPKPWGSMF